MLEDILSESWAFQDSMKKGWDKGWSKGLEEGLKAGLNKAAQEEILQLRQTLSALMEVRSPDLVALTKEKTSDIKQTAALHALILQAGTVPHADEMRQHLLAISHEQES